MKLCKGTNSPSKTKKRERDPIFDNDQEIGEILG